jgi:hypothetical protein
VHVSPSTKTDKATNELIQMPYRPEKIKKMHRIASTCLLIVRKDDLPLDLTPLMKQVVQKLSQSGMLTHLAAELELTIQSKQILMQSPGFILDQIEMNLTS